MNRLWRFTRVAPHQPTLSLCRSHINFARQRPLRTQWLATAAIRKSAPPSPQRAPQDRPVAATAASTIPTPSIPNATSSIPTEAPKSQELSHSSPNATLLSNTGSAAPEQGELPVSLVNIVDRNGPIARFNEIGVQHISDQLHRQIFGATPQEPIDEKLVELSREHLESHQLLGKQSEPTQPIGFEMPKIIGNSLDEHFYKLGAFTGEPWLDMAKEFSRPKCSLPLMPLKWNVVNSGWTKYTRDANGKIVETQCSAPEDQMLVFDVEVLYKTSPYAVIACAASPTAWYSWISPQVLGESEDDKHLIPLGDRSKARIVIGHNISYDRARIAEEYHLEQSKTFFLDTMSLHAAANGMCSRQRPTWMKHRKNREIREKVTEGANPDPELVKLIEQAENLEPELWVEESSMNSLRDVAQFHCGISISKETRDTMGEMTKVEELVPKLQECMAYCAKDVQVTHSVYQKVLPKFLETCPHPVSFSALRHMGSLLLPVNQSWTEYVNRAEGTYEELSTKVKGHLQSLTERAVSLSFGEKTKEERAAVENKILELTGRLAPVNAEYNQIVAEEKALISQMKKLPKAKRLTKAAKAEADAALEALDETASAEDKKAAQKAQKLQRQKEKEKATREREEAVAQIEAAQQELELKKKAALDGIAAIQAEAAAERKALDEFRAAAESRIEDINKNPWSKENAWLSQLDWSGREVRYKKQKKPTDPLVPVAKQKLPGYPNWYKDLFRTSTEMNVTVRTRVAPLMLRLQWDGYPLVWTTTYGWTFRVPNEDVDKYANTPMVQCEAEKIISEENPHVANDTNAVYFKLPHNGGKDTRCVNPLAKAYQRYFEDGVLTSEFAQAKEALDMNAACSYWISARERIKSQFVVWENKDEKKEMGFSASEASEAKNNDHPEKLGLILPQIVTMGTITRRAVENTWLTASNAKKNRVGSELKAMIQAPPGYCFVGADVDSEELWIASLIGDAEFKMHGGNAIGFMTLEGSKAAGTDMHSRTAAVLGISRNNAKVFNYGRIYGAGLKFAASLLRQFNPNVNESEAHKIAGNLYTVTKGTKILRRVLADKSFWRGGTESFVFNKLEDFAEQEIPQTPVLGAAITEALQKRNIKQGAFLTSRINWAIQSSGVDYLHLLIVSMDYLIQQYKLKARLMITVHDEIRYITKLEDRYKVAMALQVANIWTRSMFSQQMGINDLPQSCAFFSAVDIDHVLRKEVDLDCVTPSNPVPIPPGESVDMAALLKNPDAQLPLGEEKIKLDKIKEFVEYQPRTPVLEELSRKSKSNIYQMRAQAAMDDKAVAKVIKDIKNEAPELVRETFTKGTKAVNDYYAWSDAGSDPWTLLNLQGRPIENKSAPQAGYGWALEEVPAVKRKPLVRKTVTQM